MIKILVNTIFLIGLFIYFYIIDFDLEKISPYTLIYAIIWVVIITLISRNKKEAKE